MLPCVCCGNSFVVVRAAEAEHIIMSLWGLRRIVCGACLNVMQEEWDRMRWAAQYGIPTVRTEEGADPALAFFGGYAEGLRYFVTVSRRGGGI